MSLIRHVPLSSPCVTIPYLVYTAATILLLAPDDSAAMDGVQTGIACLEYMDETGFWVESAKNARDRIRALATRWGVNYTTKNRPLGHIDSGATDRRGNVERNSGRSGTGEPATPESRPGSQSGGSKSSLSPKTDDYGDHMGVHPGTAFDQPTENSSSTIICAYVDNMSQPYSEPLGTTYLDETTLDRISSRSSSTAVGTHQPHTARPVELGGCGSQATIVQSNVGILANASVRSAQTDAYIQLQALAYQARQPGYSESQEHIEWQSPTQPTHYHIHSHTHFHPDLPLEGIPYATQYQPNRLPHVAYESSHADPRHDFQLAYSQRHNVVPSADPNSPFLPDPSTCTDISTCFSETLRNGQDPAFIQTMVDPYADVALHWFADPYQNLSPNTCGGGTFPGAVY